MVKNGAKGRPPGFPKVDGGGKKKVAPPATSKARKAAPPPKGPSSTSGASGKGVKRKKVFRQPTMPETPSECGILLEQIAGDDEIFNHYMTSGIFGKLWRYLYQTRDHRFVLKKGKFYFEYDGTADTKDISTPATCIKFLLGSTDHRQGVDAEEFKAFRAILLDYLYESRNEKYLNKITQLMQEEIASNPEKYGGGEFTGEEEEEEEEESEESEEEEEEEQEKSQGKKKASGKKATTADGQGKSKKKKTASASGKGAVDSGLLARGVAKRARPAAEADTASFVKTCIGAEKFFGSKLASSAKGRGDGLSAPQTLIERAKQLDFPTAHEIRTTMDRLPPDHLIERRDLHSRYRACFPTWIDELLAGFNILFYGVGSKRRMLNLFADALVPDGNVLVVDGLDPRVGRAGRLLEAANNAGYGPEEDDDLVGDITAQGCNSKAAGGADGVRRASTRSCTLRARGKKRNDVPLFMIIHSLDSKILSGRSTMDALLELANRPDIHLIASVDHINSPLLWSAQQTQAINWIWHKVTTLEPYVAELAARGADKKSQTILPSGEGLRYLLMSLTPRHLELLQVLAHYQLGEGQEQALKARATAKNDKENGGKGKNKKPLVKPGAAIILGPETGMAYDKLLNITSKKLLARSSTVLEQLFTELIDHKLISKKVGTKTMLYIPRSAGELRQIEKWQIKKDK